jgi:type I restriction enzyme S subunit
MGSDWQEVALGEIFNVKHGFAFKSEWFTDEPQPTILVTPGNFSIGGGFQNIKPKYYKGPIPKDYVLKPGQIIVTMTDLSKQADTLGYSAIVPDDGNFWLHNQRIGLLEFNESFSSDPIFINYLLRTYNYRSWIIGSASGTTVKHTSPSRIHSFKCKIPPLPEQRAIAHILGSLDDKIELNHRMNRTLEAMARAIFKSWFVDFDPVRAKAEGRPTGLPDDIAALFPDSFEDSELGEIPKGWEVVTFEELTEAKQGKYIPKNDMSDIQTNEHIYPVWGGNGIRGYSSTYMYEEPVVVLTCRGSNCGRIDLTESPAWISNIAFACSPKYGSINFINVYFHFSSFSETITGSAQPQITYTSLKNKRMQFPVHKEICDAYSKKIDSLYMMIRENNRQSTTLATLRDTLLPKLISGELRVPDAEKFVEEAGL